MVGGIVGGIIGALLGGPDMLFYAMTCGAGGVLVGIIGGAIAGVGGGLYAHYTTHIEHTSFNILVATFAVAYPIVGGLRNVFGTLLAVIFVQAFLIEGLRFLGDWRNLLFGALIVAAMNLRPQGFLGGRRA